METTDLRYPIGRFDGVRLSSENRKKILLDIAELPDRLRDALQDLTDTQLDTQYRPEGWTVRQVVHHVADSHMNWYIRTKLALTSSEPTIHAYDENLWANLPDGKAGPLESSLQLLEGLHSRMVRLLEALSVEALSRKFVHPERGLVSLDQNVAMYAWHGRHHTAHITSLRKRMNWHL
jgi:uncharacterized damage-inducible protein DinB